MSDEIASLSATVSGRDVGLSQLLNRVETELRSADAAAQRTQAETLRLSSTYAQLARSLGEPAAGAAQLRSTLANLEGVTSQQELSIRRQIAALDQQAARMSNLDQSSQRGATGLRRLSDAANQLNSTLAGVGVAVGVQQLLNFGNEAISLANKTRTADNALRALAGTPKLYADALAAARNQQALFGGSLEENISGVQGLITVSRSSGVELQKLIDLSQRLAIKDPGQGAAGARIALQEAFSGDPTSLAKRYEIPKAALAALKDESVDAGQKLQILDGYLNSIGITSEVASGSIPKSAIAMNELGAAAENAKIQLGSLLADGLTPLAQQGTSFFQGIAAGLASFGQIGSQQQQINAQLLAGAGSYDAYREAAGRVNQQVAELNSTLPAAGQAFLNASTQIPVLTQQQYELASALSQQGLATNEAVAAVSQYGQQIAQFTPQQHAFAQSLIAQGQGLQQVITTVAPLGQALGVINSAQEQLVFSGQASETAAAGLAARLSELAALGGPVGATAVALADGYVLGSISADQLTTALGQLEAAQLAVANAEAFAAQRAGEHAISTSQSANASEDAAAAFTAEAGEAQIAAVEAQRLTAEKERLAQMAQAAAANVLASGGNIQATAARLAASSSLVDQLTAAYLRLAAVQPNALGTKGATAVATGVASMVGNLTGMIRTTSAAAKAQREYQAAVGGTSVELAQAREDLAKTQVGTEAYFDALTRVHNLQERSAREAAKGGKGGGGGQSAIDKEAKLAQDTNNKIEDLERDHQEKLAEIAADGEAKRLAAETSFRRQQLTGRASFYRSLGQIEDNAERQRLSARFEAIQQEAAQLRASQGADVAEEYSNAATEALQRQAELEREISEARKNKDNDQADYLEGVLALQKAADEDELNSIRTKGSTIAAEQARQYSEQERQYAEHLDRIGETYNRKIAQTPGLSATLPSPAGGASPLPSPQTVETNRTATPGTTPATSTAQRGPTLVTDPDTQQTITGSVGRLEAAIAALTEAMKTGLTEVRTAIGDLEGALGELRPREI